MMAAFGTTEIKCCDYTCFGTEELAQMVLKTMEGSAGCLMANHGMVVAGPNMTRAMWLAGELELLASQYYRASLLGEPHILTDAEIEETSKSFSSYGPQAAEA
jgi:L-fuculose-phosphate aldolase